MANIVEINDISAPELEVFTKLTEKQLRHKLEPEKGIFIAESGKVIELALAADFLVDGAQTYHGTGPKYSCPV